MKDQRNESDAVQYVNHLLFGMVKDDTFCITLKASESLPPIDVDGKPPVADYASVANRLKVMTGLNPAKLGGPVDASCQLRIAHQPYTVHVHIDDSADAPFCQIQVKSDAS